MKLEHSKIREAAKTAINLIEKYRRDYNGINKDFKPEVISEKRAALFTEFSTKMSDILPVLTAGADQLKTEREALTNPERHLVINGVKAANDMTPGQAWLAQSFKELPEAHRMAAIEQIDSDAVKLAAYMAADTNTEEGKKAAAALLDTIEINTPETRALAQLEQEARKALFEYQDRPGSGMSPASRMALGRQINTLEKVSIPAA